MKENIKELVERAVQGDKGALEQIIYIKSKDILYLACHFTNKQDYEDASQEAVYNIIKDIHKIRNPDTFEVWMYQVVQNACRNYMAHKKRQVEREAVMPLAEPLFVMIPEKNYEFLPEEYLLKKELREKVISAIDKLPENYKKVLLFAYYEGLSHEEISEILDIPIKTVYNNMTRSKARLRKILEAEAEKVFTFSMLPIGAITIIQKRQRQIVMSLRRRQPKDSKEGSAGEFYLTPSILRASTAAIFRHQAYQVTVRLENESGQPIGNGGYSVNRDYQEQQSGAGLPNSNRVGRPAAGKISRLKQGIRRHGYNGASV